MNAPLISTTPHLIDVLGNTRGREHLILKMDKAIDLVSLLDQNVLSESDCIFYDPFCKAGELLLAAAFLSSMKRTDVSSAEDISKDLYEDSRYYALCPNEKYYFMTKKIFFQNDSTKASTLTNGNYLPADAPSEIDVDAFMQAFKTNLQELRKIKNKRIVLLSSLPCQRKDNKLATVLYKAFIDCLVKGKVDQLLITSPERWFANADNIRELLEIRSGKIKYMRIKNSRWIFPSFGIREGLCYIYGDNEYMGNYMLVDSGTDQLKVPLHGFFFWRRIVRSKVMRKILRKF